MESEWTPEQRAKDAAELAFMAKWLEGGGLVHSGSGPFLHRLAALLPTLMPVSVVREACEANAAKKDCGYADWLGVVARQEKADAALSQWTKE